MKMPFSKDSGKTKEFLCFLPKIWDESDCIFGLRTAIASLVPKQSGADFFRASPSAFDDRHRQRRRLAGRSGKMMSGFKLREHSLGAEKYGIRKAAKLGHLNAVAALGASRGDAVEEDNLVFILLHQHVVVPKVRQRFGKLGQFVVVGREERSAADGIMQEFGDGPGQAHAIVGAGAPANFVEDHQALRRGIVEYVRGFGHFHHESALAAIEFIAGADTSEEAIDDSNL